MSIVRNLLHANYKENLMTRFLQINKTDFKRLFLFNHVAMATAIRQLNYQKVEVCVVDLLAAIFGDQRIEGFRGKGK